ncbi:MAG: DNA polymerase III subunit alpha [Phycisphaeraceae bacterium]|nr:DNA polymerase III subunit alpha [Phycisphaeraceae bacterium]
MPPDSPLAQWLNPDGSPKDLGKGFAHLHLHSEYSLLDGGNRVDKLVKRVKELGMWSVAVTDHGNLFGAASFYQAARDAGIVPILGVEAYVTPPERTRQDRTYTGVSDGGYHLVLLAETQEGWDNLVYLCSEAYLTGFYFKPRIDRALLAAHSAGLIAINGHLGSEMGDHLLNFERTGDSKWWDRALESAVWHRDTFGGGAAGRDAARARFFVELQHHVPEQNSINKHLVRMAREVGAPLVCDNDSHFLRAEDHDAHDTLICISMGKVKHDTERLRYPEELYVKSPAEMREIFEAQYVGGEWEEIGREALDNTLRIAARCAVGGAKPPIGQNHAPMVRVQRRRAAEQQNSKAAKGKKGDEWADMPAWDEPRFAGDLTAWFAAYCDEFEVVPLRFDDGATAEERAEINGAAKAECDRALRMLSDAGVIWRYGPKENAANRDDIRARLERELTILCDKNIAAYFLIVWDFVNWGRQRGIPANARGSGVGTMVGYVLGLSNACPVRYGLLFERFTDPDRSEYPDIDIDLCQDGRAAVIDYVRRKYGHVAQIITFGTLKARAAIRDVARVLAVPLPVADRVAKLVPEQLNITLDDALGQEPELRRIYEGDGGAIDKLHQNLPPGQRAEAETLRALIDNARTIEGQARHASVHAAGVIVATRPLHEIVPLYKQSGAAEHEVVTQWDGPTCEKVGLLKMDFLGLRTLSVIERAKKLIRETLSEEEIWKAVGRAEDYQRTLAARQADAATKSGKSSAHPTSDIAHPTSVHPLDLERLAYDDPRVFGLFQRADTTGVFQFESGGMRRLLVDMRPDRLEDLIAANALFRPGPMDLIPDYNRRKHGQAEVPRVHPIVDGYTAETYGVMVYQEQVMQIVHGLGGIKLRDAYTLIKNIGKKKHDKIEKERPKFVEGAQQQGLTRQAAEELFELILKFAGYGFNKSHSTGYAIVAYQTAYLKTYFPNQYMAAFLTYESQAQKVADWIPYVEDCRTTRFVNGKMGVEVRPPDVNLSREDFGVVFDEGEPRDALHGHVRFGLRAIKGAGDKAIEAIVQERDGGGGGAGAPPKRFTSLFDFCERVMARLAAQAAAAGANGSASGGNANLLNKTTLEALIKCGAMDSLHPPEGRGLRAAMCASIESAMSAAQKVAQDKAAGQGGLFMGGGAGAGAKSGAKAEGSLLAKTTAWSESDTLAREKEVLGFYVSSHPLEEWSAWTKVFVTAGCDAAKALAHDSRVVLAGLIGSVRTLIVKTGRSAGQKMAIVPIEDQGGSIEVVLFADRYAQFVDTVQPGNAVFVVGRIDRSRAGAAPNSNAGAIDDEPGAMPSNGKGRGGGAGGGGAGGVGGGRAAEQRAGDRRSRGADRWRAADARETLGPPRCRATQWRWLAETAGTRGDRPRGESRRRG